MDEFNLTNKSFAMDDFEVSSPTFEEASNNISRSHLVVSLDIHSDVNNEDCDIQLSSYMRDDTFKRITITQSPNHPLRPNDNNLAHLNNFKSPLISQKSPINSIHLPSPPSTIQNKDSQLNLYYSPPYKLPSGDSKESLEPDENDHLAPLPPSISSSNSNCNPSFSSFFEQISLQDTEDFMQDQHEISQVANNQEDYTHLSIHFNKLITEHVPKNNSDLELKNDELNSHKEEECSQTDCRNVDNSFDSDNVNSAPPKKETGNDPSIVHENRSVSPSHLSFSSCMAPVSPLPPPAYSQFPPSRTPPIIVEKNGEEFDDFQTPSAPSFSSQYPVQQVEPPCQVLHDNSRDTLPASSPPRVRTLFTSSCRAGAPKSNTPLLKRRPSPKLSLSSLSNPHAASSSRSRLLGNNPRLDCSFEFPPDDLWGAKLNFDARKPSLPANQRDADSSPEAASQTGCDVAPDPQPSPFTCLHHPPGQRDAVSPPVSQPFISPVLPPVLPSISPSRVVVDSSLLKTVSTFENEFLIPLFAQTKTPIPSPLQDDDPAHILTSMIERLSIVLPQLASILPIPKDTNVDARDAVSSGVSHSECASSVHSTSFLEGAAFVQNYTGASGDFSRLMSRLKATQSVNEDLKKTILEMEQTSRARVAAADVAKERADWQVKDMHARVKMMESRLRTKEQEVEKLKTRLEKVIAMDAARRESNRAIAAKAVSDVSSCSSWTASRASSSNDRVAAETALVCRVSELEATRDSLVRQVRDLTSQLVRANDNILKLKMSLDNQVVGGGEECRRKYMANVACTANVHASPLKPVEEVTTNSTATQYEEIKMKTSPSIQTQTLVSTAHLDEISVALLEATKNIEQAQHAENAANQNCEYFRRELSKVLESHKKDNNQLEETVIELNDLRTALDASKSRITAAEEETSKLKYSYQEEIVQLHELLRMSREERDELLSCLNDAETQRENAHASLKRSQESHIITVDSLNHALQDANNTSQQFENELKDIDRMYASINSRDLFLEYRMLYPPANSETLKDVKRSDTKASKIISSLLLTDNSIKSFVKLLKDLLIHLTRIALYVGAADAVSTVKEVEVISHAVKYLPCMQSGLNSLVSDLQPGGHKSLSQLLGGGIEVANEKVKHAVDSILSMISSLRKAPSTLLASERFDREKLLEEQRQEWKGRLADIETKNQSAINLMLVEKSNLEFQLKQNEHKLEILEQQMHTNRKQTCETSTSPVSSLKNSASSMTDLLKMSMNQNHSTKEVLLRRLLLLLSHPHYPIVSSSNVDDFLTILPGASNSEELVNSIASDVENFLLRTVAPVPSPLLGSSQETARVVAEVMSLFGVSTVRDCFPALRRVSDSLKAHRETLVELCDLLGFQRSIADASPPGRAVVCAIREILMDSSPGGFAAEKGQEQRQDTTRVRDHREELINFGASQLLFTREHHTPPHANLSPLSTAGAWNHAQGDKHHVGASRFPLKVHSPLNLSSSNDFHQKKGENRSLINHEDCSRSNLTILESYPSLSSDHHHHLKSRLNTHTTDVRAPNNLAFSSASLSQLHEKNLKEVGENGLSTVRERDGMIRTKSAIAFDIKW